MAKSMEPPAVPTEAPDVEMLQLELAETRERLVRMEGLMKAVEERIRVPMPGQPVTASPLDGDAKVSRILEELAGMQTAALKILAEGPKKFSVALKTGEKVIEATRRDVGAFSEGDAIHKYKVWARIQKEGEPTQVVATEVAA